MNLLMLAGHLPPPPIIRPYAPPVQAERSADPRTVRRLSELERVASLIAAAPGLTRLQIAARLGMEPRTVTQRLTELRRQRRVTIDRDAVGCYWYPLDIDNEEE